VKPPTVLLLHALRQCSQSCAGVNAGLGGFVRNVLGGVAGVGFTMALFIAQLAFTDPQLLAAAKLEVPLDAWLLKCRHEVV
jgi:hypothetical protein